MESQPSYSALSKAGSEKAQFYFKHRRIAYFGALFVAILMLLPIGIFSYIFATIAIIIEILAWLFRYKGEHYHSLPRELIRRSMLFNSFGKPDESLYIDDLLKEFDREELIKKANLLDKEFYPIDSYYQSKNILDNIQESAFWSKHLFKIAAQKTIQMLAIISFIVILILLVNQDISLIPKITLIIFTFVIADELSTFFAWKDAVKSCEKVYDRVTTIMKKNGKPSQDVVNIQ